MSQLEGGLTVDQGYRVVEAGGSSPSTSRTRSFDPGLHRDESLGVEVYGAEAWHSPGFGESHPDCGTYRVEGVCESCGETHVAPHQCGRRGCPDCWGIWAKETALSRTVRLQAVRCTSGFKQAAHAVVSFDEPGNTVREYLDGRSQAAEVAREKGFVGFDVIAHPTRLTDEGKELVKDEQPNDDPRGDHVWLRDEYPGRYHFGQPNSLLEWSPHYHIIGLTSPDMEPGAEQDPYVYQFFRSFERFDLHDEDSYNDVYGAYRYLLSHVGLHEDRQFQAVVGYGRLSNTTYTEYEPTVGILRKIEEMAEKVAAHGLDREESPARAGSGEDELGDCSECDDGVVINIFRVPDFLEQAQPPPDIRDRMVVAYEWRTGKIHPPPGARNPSTPEEAREVMDLLMSQSL